MSAVSAVVQQVAKIALIDKKVKSDHMVSINSVEGVIKSSTAFHHDMDNDVLYLRLSDTEEAAAYADEQPDGTLLLKSQETDEAVGLTVINWWKQFGQGTRPHSLRNLELALEPWAKKLAV